MKKRGAVWRPFLLSTVVMWHILRQDDGELDEPAYNLFGVVLIPGCLVDEFFLALFRNRVDVGGCIVQQMPNDLLSAFVVAFHQVATTSVAVHLDGTIVLIKDFAVFGADSDGQVKAFEIVKLIHSACKFSAKIEFFYLCSVYS